MTDYLDSLDTLDALCAKNDVRFILPAHGYVLSHCDAAQAAPEQSGDARSDTRGGARRAISALKAHRLKREAKVIAAMKLKPQGSAQDLLPIAYSDVDSKLWPIASRSLTAHIQRIERLKLL